MSRTVIAYVYTRKQQSIHFYVHAQQENVSEVRVFFPPDSSHLQDQLLYDPVKQRMRMTGLNDCLDQSYVICDPAFLQFPTHNFYSYVHLVPF